MSTILEIFTKIYEDPNIKDPRSYISLYDQNKTVIENSDTSICFPIDKKQGSSKVVIQLMADYALALSGIGNYNLSIVYFNKVIPLLENDLNSQNQNPFSESLYEGLIWNRATVLFYLKKYDIAAREFKKLVSNFPDNDKYFEGPKTCKIAKLTIIQNIIWIILGIEFLITFIIPKVKMNLLFLVFCGITFVIALSFEFWKYALRKKKVNISNKLD